MSLGAKSCDVKLEPPTLKWGVAASSVDAEFANMFIASPEVTRNITIRSRDSRMSRRDVCMIS